MCKVYLVNYNSNSRRLGMLGRNREYRIMDRKKGAGKHANRKITEDTGTPVIPA